jgi:hypothetical protein
VPSRTTDGPGALRNTRGLMEWVALTAGAWLKVVSPAPSVRIALAAAPALHLRTTRLAVRRNAVW